MTLEELNRDQIIQLKQVYYTRKMEDAGQGVSYGELAMIDELVTDQELEGEYSGTTFVPDDFT